MTTDISAASGNQTNQALPTQKTTITYDKENRMKEFFGDAVAHTFSYDEVGYKRCENKNGVLSTLIWGRTDYLGEI